MDWQGVLVLMVIGVVLLVRHQIHLRRYPDIACRRCKGAARRKSTNLLGRPVSGKCPKCDGSPWSPRRGGG